MKVVLWGLSSPKFIELVAAELRRIAPLAALSVQIPEAARSVDYCGVQPEEFLRVGEGDLAQLSGIVSRMQKHDSVLVLDIWSLVLLPDFVGFLNGVAEFAHKLKAIVFLSPEAWPGVWRENRMRAGSTDAVVQEILFDRVLKAVELVLNCFGPFVLLQSPPPLVQAGYYSGRDGLPALRRFGFDRAPRALFREKAKFCSHESLAKALAQCLEDAFRGRKGDWRRRVDADIELSPERFLRAEDKEWAVLTRLTQFSMSWDGYCSQSPRAPVRFGSENRIVKPSAYVAWLYGLAILEREFRVGAGQKIPVESAFKDK